MKHCLFLQIFKKFTLLQELSPTDTIQKISCFPSPYLKQAKTHITHCPGLDQDRVNFHRNPGRGTAGWADPTWPTRTGCSIPCAIMLGSGGVELGGEDSLAARERVAPVWSRRAAL